jgi:hypothetical protein
LRDLILHVPTGIEIDFNAGEGFGNEDADALMHEWRKQERHRTPRGDFICLNAVHSTEDPGMLYFREERNRIYAEHWPGTKCKARYAHGMTPEHRHMVAYAERGTDAHGVPSKRENRLATGVRNDLTVFGSAVDVGVEVQRTDRPPREIKSRTTKALRANTLDVWYNATGKTPPWFGLVPSVGMSLASWATSLPPPRSVAVASGVRVIEAVPCRDIRNGSCPDHARGCSERHPVQGPMLDVLADDLAVMVASGDLTAMRYYWPRIKVAGRTVRRAKELIFLVTPDHKQLYENLTDRDATFRVHPLAGQRQLRDRGYDCSRGDQDQDSAAVVPIVESTPASQIQVVSTYEPAKCSRDGTVLMQLIPGKLYCSVCFGREMNRRGLANYPIRAEPDRSKEG